MERSPRSAGVPRAGASMGQCHTLRSFVISLAIAIVITKSPASGFTIARDPLTPDLETGESKQLEVKYDLKTLNNNETINNNTREYSNSTVIAIKNQNNTLNYSEMVTEKRLVFDKTGDKETKMSETNKVEIPSYATILISTETANNAFDTTSPTTSQTTTTVSYAYNTTVASTQTTASADVVQSQPLSTIFSTPTLPTTPISVIENTSVTNKSEKNESTIAEHKNDTNGNDAGKSESKTNDFSNDNQQPETTTNDLAYSAKTSIEDIENKYTTEAVFTDQKVDQTNTKEKSTIAKTDSSLDVSPTASSQSKSEVTSENLTTDGFTINLDVSKLPHWKKYTTIDRKRTSTEDTTTTQKDMVLAETAQTGISLEKAFTNTPISSLEKLRNGLINAQESTARLLQTTTAVDSSISNTSNSETNTFTTKTDVDTEVTKLEIVSKRAGYKDNRGTGPPKPEEATTTVFTPKVSTNQIDLYSTIYDAETSEVEVAKNQNGSVYESQSQLAEDAIKEELLEEKTLNDNEDNAKFLQQERLTDGAPDSVTVVDTLSVKPIGQEKKKNTILYAVSPNYKPLKKIDVQPPKQFVRDPDDNSWRNESISSLGIVFKPKNASKSFTQVLKNKTETLLGNMTDKDSKDGLPDLRVRLEKIAEVRKSKKRINKFGDTIYSDYEESSENTNPSREDTTTPMTPSVHTTLNFSPPPPSQSSTADYDLTVNTISKEHFDLFKTDISSPLTTNPYKPKKFYNLAEYYDTTDDYDVDYVNQHKIDLKKFTKPMKTTEVIVTQPPELLRTQPPELLRTQPMTEYQPERKATLQYFPPTQKVVQKVNLNDYDTNFNRKVYDNNKEPPKNALAVSFGTVAPTPTTRYEPLNKVSMKPAYTPMYQPDNLDKNLYLTNQPHVSEPPPHDGTFNRASYVIKHYRDFISEAAKGGEDEGGEEYPYTEAPVHGVTVSDLAKMNPSQGEDEYEYDVKYRKDIMNRFVDNFNQNSERFKVDFPIIYNSSVIHRPPEHGRVASSTAFMKRLYEVSNTRPSNFLRRPCDPQCDKTVELSPAYELHYYVPDEEEKEEIQSRPVTPPYRYRL